MNHAARSLTARERDAALARLRFLTRGTAVAAIVATGGFGALAAASYAGQPAAANGLSGVASDSTVSQSNGSTGAAQATPAPSPSSASASSAGGLQPTAPPTTTRKKSHVSTGGSS